MEKIKNIGFYGSGFDTKKLSYVLIPEFIRGTCDQVKLNNPELAAGRRPVRRDGGYGWFIVTEGIDEIDGNFAGCNGYSYLDQSGTEKSMFNYYWLGDSFDDGLSSFLREFKKYIEWINPVTGEFTSEHEENIADLLSCGLLEKRNGRYYCTFPILTRSQYQMLLAVLKPYSADIAALLKDWMLFLQKEYELFTPKRLRDQILGNIDSYSYNAAAFIAREL
jgi:hypothetical protein